MFSSTLLLFTYKARQFTEPPRNVNGKNRPVAFLQRQVGQVIRESAELLGDGGIAQIQQNVQTKGFQGGEVILPTGIIKLDADGVLLILRQAQHLQMIVAHEIICLTQIITKTTLLKAETYTCPNASAKLGQLDHSAHS